VSRELEDFAAALFGPRFDRMLAKAEREIRKAREEGAAAVVEPIEKAWAEIEREASRLVHKSATPISQERAVAKLLGTPKGKTLYASYIAAQDLVAFTHASTEAEWGRRDTARWVADRASDRILKAAAKGADVDELIDAELAENPLFGEALALLRPVTDEPVSVSSGHETAPRGTPRPLTVEGNQVDPAQEEEAVWDMIVSKAGAGDPGRPGFSMRIRSFLKTPLGQRLYGRYERAFAQRVLAEDRNRGPRPPRQQSLPPL
jgi:hypothetical protein